VTAPQTPSLNLGCAFEPLSHANLWIGLARFPISVYQRRLAVPSHATRNPGAGQDLTGLAAAVQLRLRVAVLADDHQGCKL
jgi:hypothetical protein